MKDECNNTTSNNPEFGIFPKLSALLTKCFDSVGRINCQVIRLENATSLHRKDELGEDMEKMGIAKETGYRMEHLLEKLKKVENELRNQTNTLLGMPPITADSTSEL